MKADPSLLRYAQCWEDADVLLAALDPGPGDVLVSIASAGDNTLSLLSRGPERVVAVDLSPAQIAALELRVAAYAALEHGELLELVGSVASPRRAALYRRIRERLSPAARAFWDARPEAIARGVGDAGRFERYFRLFRARVLPLVHRRARVERLLAPKPRAAREAFYAEEWDTPAWRLLFRAFFSRFLLGRLGRDPSFFDHVEGPVAERILDRTRHALTVLDPAANPYLQWILTGRHRTALPHALRPETFAAIRENLPRLEWRLAPLEDVADELPPGSVDGFNLSDVFEYLPLDAAHALLARLARAARPGARFAYWNMLAPRSRPPSMAAALVPLDDLAVRLHHEDKAFFYSRFVVEEVAR